MGWMERGTGEGLRVAAPLGCRLWPRGLMVVRGRGGAREKVSWCFVMGLALSLVYPELISFTSGTMGWSRE